MCIQKRYRGKDNFVKLWAAQTEYFTSVFSKEDFQLDTCFSLLSISQLASTLTMFAQVAAPASKNIWICHSWTQSWLSH